MSINEFLHFAGQIQTLALPDEEKEQLMVQAADLIRFKESYPEKIELIKTFNPNVNIVTTNTGTAGILFYNTQDKTTSLEHVIKNTERFSQLKKVQELWLVFVAGPQELCQKKLTHLMAGYNVKKHYCKVFYFNFFNRNIQVL